MVVVTYTFELYFFRMFFTFLTDSRNIGLTNTPYLVLPPVSIFILLDIRPITGYPAFKGEPRLGYSNTMIKCKNNWRICNAFNLI